MSKQLNPKQYIQTKARSLPIYKCFVNKDWEEAREANVVIMRKHSNGNITASMYLVDLLCLGIKDTMYFFNEPESALKEQFGKTFSTMFTEVDYNIAHNIVYAGHDFAMEFDIKPHADFNTTKFILEEDNDNIELVEIEVGEDGKPHLIVNQPGQYSDALAKLKKHAGEGNYNFTIAVDGEDDEEYDDEHDEDEYSEDVEKDQRMDDFASGEITPLTVMGINLVKLLNAEAFNKRVDTEKLTINTESRIRLLSQLRSGLFTETLEYNTTEEYINADSFCSGISDEQEVEFDLMQEKLGEFYSTISPGDAENATVDIDGFLLQTIDAYQSNPLVIISAYDMALAENKTEIVEALREKMQALSSQFPAAMLMLALEAYIKDGSTGLYSDIYNSETIDEAFPGVVDLGDYDVNIYSLLQTLVKLDADDFSRAVYYYYLAAETDVYIGQLLLVQAKLIISIDKELKVNNNDNSTELHAV
jgi:hypothetical protein